MFRTALVTFDTLSCVSIISLLLEAAGYCLSDVWYERIGVLILTINTYSCLVLSQFSFTTNENAPTDLSGRRHSSRKWRHMLTVCSTDSHISTRFSHPPLQICPQTKNELCHIRADNTSRPPSHPAPPLSATCSWDKGEPDSESGGGEEGGCVSEGQWWRKYLVSSLLARLIGRYWKMSFVPGPPPAWGTEDPPHWRTITSRDLQVWVALLNLVVGHSIIAGPHFSCDNRQWLQLW